LSNQCLKPQDFGTEEEGSMQMSSMDSFCKEMMMIFIKWKHPVWK
jgi:hypothetical protein